MGKLKDEKYQVNLMSTIESSSGATPSSCDTLAMP
jgi:hypothetical protein